MNTTGSLASLPMYDLPELQSANDQFWAGIRHALCEAGLQGVPGQLDRTRDGIGHWSDPNLMLSQTCGYPLTHQFDGRLQLVATPVYDVPGCDGANYCSFIVVAAGSSWRRPGDLVGAQAAFNTPDSLSGMLALKAVFAPFARDGRVFGQVMCSGSHLQSMEMVAAGKADVAAIDCVTYALVARHRPRIIEALRVIASSPSAPALPFVTAPHRPSREVDLLRQALVLACEAPALAPARDRLRLTGVEFLTRADYDRVLEIERQAERHGYAQLA